jgi:hypothetical protein
MGRIIEVRVLVECLCRGRGVKNCDPEDWSGGRCGICAGHPGQREKWVSYDDLLDQIQEDLSRKPDPRSQV